MPDGILRIDKPRAMKSHDAVEAVRRAVGIRVVGHTGTLDPEANGLLLMCLGRATKFAKVFEGLEKTYWVVLRLGLCTDTQDAAGRIVRVRSVPTRLTREDVNSVLRTFTGHLRQRPPMYSAVKQRGRRLYHLARDGITVDRPPRDIYVRRLQLLEMRQTCMTLTVTCSKGTYVRTLGEDIGLALGCGAHVVALRRTTAGPYTEDDLVTFDDMSRMAELGRLDDLLQPVATAVGQWQTVELAGAPAFFLKQGQPVLVPHAPTEGWVRLYEQENDDGRFIGVGEILGDGRVAPRRLIV